MNYSIEFYRKEKYLANKVLLEKDDFSKYDVFLKIVNNSLMENNFGFSLK